MNQNEPDTNHDLQVDAIDTDEVVFDDYDDVPEESPPTAQDSMRYYGVDFDVSGLVRRLNDGDLEVPSFDPSYNEPKSRIQGFQRRFVWPKKQMDRFIESLLLGYPVPGIFLLERPNRKFLILDGQQRLKTLQSFYDGSYEQPGGKIGEFVLENVGEQFRGKAYKNLSDADRRLLDSTVLQSTIVVPKEDKMEAIYLVFERINSGGIKLQPQEIRVALYFGELIHLLRDLNANESWRALFGAPHTRLKDHELILRYLVLTDSAELLVKHGWSRESARSDEQGAEKLYHSGMASSLNRYLEHHRNLEGLNPSKIMQEFSTATDLLNRGIGKPALRPRGGTQVNAAHTEALLVGITMALRNSVNITPEKAMEVNAALLNDDLYMKSITESTSRVENVINRLEIAVSLFSRP